MNDIISTEGFQDLYKEYLSKTKSTNSLKINYVNSMFICLFLATVFLIAAVVTFAIARNSFGYGIAVFNVVISCWFGYGFTNSDFDKVVGPAKLAYNIKQFFYSRKLNKENINIKPMFTKDFYKYMKTVGEGKYSTILVETKTMLHEVSRAKDKMTEMLEVTQTASLVEVINQVLESLTIKEKLLNEQKTLAESQLGDFQSLCSRLEEEFSFQSDIEKVTSALGISNKADDFIKLNQVRLEELASGTLRADEALKAFVEIKNSQSLDSLSTGVLTSTT